MTTVNEEPAALWDRLERNRLINTWVRERCPELAARMAERSTEAAAAVWEIPVGSQSLLAVCGRYSPGGFHDWNAIRLHDSQTSADEIAPFDLARLMLDSLRQGTSDAKSQACERILQSIESSRSHAAFLSKQKPVSSAEQAERSLWFGHPFHPLAKSIVGFTSADFEKYGPERHAQFQLCWLLAEPDRVESYVCTPELMSSADAVLAEASGLSKSAIAGRTLIPCHPWQAARLRNIPHIRDDLNSGALSVFGPSGNAAVPTSSVRTIWFKEHGLFVKLPLEARITNFSRVNTAEHLARSVAGARAIAAAAEQVRAAGLTILREVGGRILRDRRDSRRSYPETGFLLRLADFDEGADPIVVAGFVERDPRTGRPNVSAIAGRHFDEQQRTFEWVERYMEVVLLPLIRLFATTGLCLEAHAQNSLVGFENGWPRRLFVRDLEGVAADREVFQRARPSAVACLDEALFYERDVVRRRFLYYVIVNHVAHVLSAVAELSGMSEESLWTASRSVLEKEAGAARTIIEELLSASFLPAKANLTSCVAGRGETPDYVMIANPFTAGCANIRPRKVEEASP
ncbi:IucA/IucC family protein [Methylocystis iwaonis]|uniref:L-2,3-diaminopropanoate--citrate ligase SbnE n=1 Tax=Methylocystis iwaonis TaxID=2885079 RepID=A0ABM8EEB7_9HYPH|nr:IucA/IucC family protein [Methylocystis iwaonis]BDV36379.1 L-2,3-diaminopropanoate--citrate ligase SbnE [Methylocystis iwaonis]